MKKLIISLAALLIIATEPSIAGSQRGFILKLRAGSSSINFTHFQLSGAYSDRPSCSTLGEGWWAINTDTSEGKAFLATLLLAYAQKLEIRVGGIGVCSLRPDMETAIQVNLGPD